MKLAEGKYQSQWFNPRSGAWKQKQGLRGVDATTSATITSEAIINATAKALGSGLK